MIMEKMPSIDKEYFLWLISKVISRKNRANYFGLCRLMYDTQFTWFVPNDGNRVDDALELREQFVYDQGLDPEYLEVIYFFKKPCVVLEVLTAIAKRMNDLMYNLNDPNDYTQRWFDELVKNLRLQDYTTNHDTRLSPKEEAEVESILRVMMDRTYDFYGNGGLFPQKSRPPNDQRKVEIWYQMMLYLAENYT